MGKIYNPTEIINNYHIWPGFVKPKPIDGGITNHNYLVSTRGKKYFVRLGEDIPSLGVMRFNEIAATVAAHLAGISPKVIFSEKGIIVMEFIDGVHLTPKQLTKPKNLRQIVELLKKCHQKLPLHLNGPVLAFCVFQVIRAYAHTIGELNQKRRAELDNYVNYANELESHSGRSQMVFCHNDLLSGNFIHANDKLWLVDWDYAGYNNPMFDLANLASNNHFTEDTEQQLLESYFGIPLNHKILHDFHVMKCASLLREAMWSMVSEVTSSIDFDYVNYTEKNLQAFHRAHQTLATLKKQ